ncbi:MAG: molybdopterin-binding protein [Thermoleophilia bacterium]|nr:molybdopterin-binding protein [Thermoleophilia bacterium]
MCEPDQITVPVRDAIGLVLSHDITEVNAVTHHKCSAFRRGHVITDNDIPKLLDLGKENIYVLDISEGQMHEDDAVLLMVAALAGKNAEYLPEPREGRINIIAGVTGLLKVDAEALERFNLVEEVMCATRHTNTVVQAGDIIAGTRAIPLVVEKEFVEQAVAIAEAAGGVAPEPVPGESPRRSHGIISVLPLKPTRTAIIITGNEVYTGRIDDAFEPIIREKVEALGSEVVSVVKCPDNMQAIRQAVLAAHEVADLIIMTGGMSVDPDDMTPLAAREAGAEIAAYGSAVLPGAMFMVSYFEDGTPVLGVPACGIHHPRTIFDLILPRVLAGETITSRDIAKLGHGGLCLDCPECEFPVCPFGKSA